jgi:hypothetical protein
MANPKAPPPVTLPTAPVAPGAPLVNTLAPPGVVLRIFANYNRDGALWGDEAEYPLRLLRPGAILLPNLDISQPTRLPLPPPADLKGSLDGKNSTIDGSADEAQLTIASFDVPPGIPSRAVKAVLRIDAKDAARIRAFRAFPFLGALFSLSVGLGDGTSESVVFDAATDILVPTYLIEAVTLAGDPAAPAPTGPSPDKPTPVRLHHEAQTFTAKLPHGSSGAPVFKHRAPGDVWFEVVHQDDKGADLKSPRDAALFTIAPFLLLCGIQPATQVFVVNMAGDSGNQNFIYDLAEACQAVFGAAKVPLPADTSSPPTPVAHGFTGPFYLIDGAKVSGDPWIQDEIEIGYCFAPHASIHVVLHCKRNRGLDKFVHADLPGSKMGLFDALHAPDDQSDSPHYGGNLEATPPVKEATPAIAAGAAGPAVKAHSPALFGKILLGDAKPRAVDSDYRDFLIAQHVQPVLPIDTAWLAVGHVDEIISFVADSSAKGYKMLFASINTMTVLLQETVKVSVASGRTNLHRGKWARPLAGGVVEYSEISVEDLLAKSKAFNDQVRSEKMIPIDQRLKTGLHLAESDIVRIPTYFEPPPVAAASFSNVRTAALTVGMVNMLVADKHLMIPKPFGPRMKVSDAQDVLKRVFSRLGVNPPVRMPAAGDVRWVEPGDSATTVASYYTDAPTAADRQNIIDFIKGTDTLTAANQTLVSAEAAALATANVAAAGLVSKLTPAIAPGQVGAWFRIAVPDNKVDVIEAYMLSVLDPLGVTVHFVDDWFYHSLVGEAHCATNAVRVIPEDKEAKRWWDHYDPSVDTGYAP